jgi:hypothetical protein
MVKLSKWPTSWKLILKLMTDNVVISEVDTIMYIVLSKAQKYCLMGINWYH